MFSDRVTTELGAFTQYLREFYDKDGLNAAQKEKLLHKIERKLSPDSPFTAFKIWMIKSRPRLMQDFSQFLN